MNNNVNWKRARTRKSNVRQPALVPCVFLLDVMCSFRRSEKVSYMDRCSNCPQFKRFEREMDEEDKKTMDEFDEIRRTGVY